MTNKELHEQIDQLDADIVKLENIIILGNTRYRNASDEIESWKKFTGCSAPELAASYIQEKTKESQKYRSAFQALQHLLEAINLTTK